MVSTIDEPNAPGEEQRLIEKLRLAERDQKPDGRTDGGEGCKRQEMNERQLVPVRRIVRQVVFRDGRGGGTLGPGHDEAAHLLGVVLHPGMGRYATQDPEDKDVAGRGHQHQEAEECGEPNPRRHAEREGAYAQHEPRQGKRDAVGTRPSRHRALGKRREGLPVHAKPNVVPRGLAPHVAQSVEPFVEHDPQHECAAEQRDGFEVGRKRRFREAPQREMGAEGEQGDGGQEGRRSHLGLRGRKDGPGRRALQVRNLRGRRVTGETDRIREDTL